MVNQLNKEILKKIDEIIKLIEESPDYQKYLKLKEEIQKNDEIMLMINKVKVLQKDVTHHIDKEAELNTLNNELNNHPLYREYQNILSDLNNQYSIIENSINKYFQNKLN